MYNGPISLLFHGSPSIIYLSPTSVLMVWIFELFCSIGLSYFTSNHTVLVIVKCDVGDHDEDPQLCISLLWLFEVSCDSQIFGFLYLEKVIGILIGIPLSTQMPLGR